MPTPNWTKAVIAIAAGAIFLIALVTGQTIDKVALRWLSLVTTGVILLLLAYDRWVWRWPIIRKVAEFAGRPVIRGTWKGQLEYERDADDKPGSTIFFLVVDQSFSNVQVRAFVSTSESYSLTATIARALPTRRQLIYAYRSEAPYTGRDENRPHDGTAVLALIGIPVEEITGSYYNDRQRRGTIRLTEHRSKLAESFEQAERIGMGWHALDNPEP